MTKNSQPKPWPEAPVDLEHFRQPPREYGILPFWFLNGKLDPEEMRFQLEEFCRKGMPGIILHGRYGLEQTYLGETYLERIRLAVEEAKKLGMKTWIYDEMNWPSGTADKRVLAARPDLVQRYIECINFTVRGPWFTYLTGADSRYNDFEKSTPVAAFAVRLDGETAGQVIDLTPNLSFRDVIPWEAPQGTWRLIYIVEKVADYYIDALNPESTAEFLKLGYEPYKAAVDGNLSTQMLGFYTDEPAMHYYLTGGDNPIVPWTKDMFRRFQGRNGYNLRPRLPDLFFDISPDSARVRYDFFTTLTEFYSSAFYQQIHEWCVANNVLFTGHLLYEEWLRSLIRVEGNQFKHYPHMDVIGVDHLYPIIGNRDRPAEHVALKAGSSAAHQLGSPRLLCESFGGIFMDATMQRMKWIADWEYVLGVNLLNPHGFHYTLEGPRKRDWPPSMFYQYPWWHYYGEFSTYIGRLSHMLSGGRHVAKVAVLWPINAMFATYTPQTHSAFGDRIEHDFNALTDLLLRLHYDFDYVDEDLLTRATLEGAEVRLKDETYELLVIPPMTHIKLSTLERMEQLAAQGGRLLGMIFLPDTAFTEVEGRSQRVDIRARVQALFGIDPLETQQTFRQQVGIEVIEHELPGGGKSAFVRSYALIRQLPLRLQQQPGNKGFVIEAENESPRYYCAVEGEPPQEITAEVNAERQEVLDQMRAAVAGLIEPDVTIDNPEILYLHRVKDDQDIYFLINPTFTPQMAQVTLPGDVQPAAWDPSTGREQIIAPSQYKVGRTGFKVELPATGSVFILPKPAQGGRIVDSSLTIEAVEGGRVRAYGEASEPWIDYERKGQVARLRAESGPKASFITLDGEWDFKAEDDNALVIGQWLAKPEAPGNGTEQYLEHEPQEGWLPMVPGAWAYQLPSEPEAPYPIPVWYRAQFEIESVPPRLDLIVDGFAGSEWQIYANGQPVTAAPQRSRIDGQMMAVEITPNLRQGTNTLVIRLVVTNATDGLLDLLKLVGDFSLGAAGTGGWRITAPRTKAQPASWTAQGYPFYSGRAVYRKELELPEGFAGQKVFLEPGVRDDTLEVVVNGVPAGVRLWEPYRVEVTELLRPGMNSVELRVANTLVNLLEAVERPSGVVEAPRLMAYPQYEFTLGE